MNPISTEDRQKPRNASSFCRKPRQPNSSPKPATALIVDPGDKPLQQGQPEDADGHRGDLFFEPLCLFRREQGCESLEHAFHLRRVLNAGQQQTDSKRGQRDRRRQQPGDQEPSIEPERYAQRSL